MKHFKFKIILTALLYFSFFFFVPNNSYAYEKITPLVKAEYHAPLYDIYPYIGEDEYQFYFLDNSSCYSRINGNVAELGGLVYGVNKYNSEKREYIYQYKTYKQKKKRKIILDKITKEGKVIANNIDADKDQYLYGLFWRIAGVTGINHDLD